MEFVIDVVEEPLCEKYNEGDREWDDTIEEEDANVPVIVLLEEPELDTCKLNADVLEEVVEEVYVEVGKIEYVCAIDDVCDCDNLEE